MSKFCSKCGSMCMDEARVCGNCGNILEAPQQNNFSQPQFQPGYAQNIPTPGFNPASDVKPKKKSKIGIIIGAALAVVAIVVAVILIVSSTSGSEGLVKKFIKAYDNEDPKAWVEIMPDFYEEFAENVGGVEDIDMKDAAKTEIDYFYDYIEALNDNMDGELKLSYKITDEEELDDDEMDNLIDELETRSEGFKKKLFTEGIKYEIDVTVKCNGEEEEIELELAIIKYDDEWYYLYHEWDYSDKVITEMNNKSEDTYADDDYDYTSSYYNDYWDYYYDYTTSYYDYWDDYYYDYTTSYYDYYDYYDYTTSYYDYYDYYDYYY